MMNTYRQYCPIARASEILAERWNPLIIRNLMFGADTFSELARGVPAMSRSMLIKRLGEMQRAGIVAKTRKLNGHGYLYFLTDAGKDLVDVIGSLGTWGERWVEVTTEHSDPGFALWAWCQAQMDDSHLPDQRTVIAFAFPDQPPTNRYYWFLIEGGVAEMCYSDPGDEPALEVEAESLPFVNWHRGALEWPQAVRSGQIRLRGSRELARSLPKWNTHMPRFGGLET
jgi:DNA-binding HxlR family transcriptional regulator